MYPQQGYITFLRIKAYITFLISRSLKEIFITEKVVI